MKVGDLKVVLKLSVTKFKAGILAAKSQLKGFGERTKKLGQTFKASFGFMIRQLKRFALVGTGIFVGMTVAAARFEEEIHRTAVIIGKGTEVAASQYTALIEKARELGRETLFSSTQAAKGMQLMAKAGFNTKEIVSSIADVVNLAVAGNLELESATSVVAAALRQFQLNAADAGKVADVLTVTANSAMITVEGLGEAMKYAAPVAKALGNDLEDTASIMAAVANLGLEASQVGTALRRMMVRLLAPTAQVQKSLDKLGLQTVDQASGKMRKMIDILSDLQKKFKEGSMTQVEFQKALAQVAGTRGVTALMGIVGQANLDLSIMSDNLRNVQGSAKKMADEFRKTTIGRFKDLIASVNELSITIVGAFGDSIRNTLFGIRNWVLGLQQALEANGKLKTIIEALKEGFSPLTAKIKEFADTVLRAVEGMDAMEIRDVILAKFAQLNTILYDMGEAFKVIAGAIKPVFQALEAIGVAWKFWTGGEDKDFIDEMNKSLYETALLQKRINDERARFKAKDAERKEAAKEMVGKSNNIGFDEGESARVAEEYRKRREHEINLLLNGLSESSKEGTQGTEKVRDVMITNAKGITRVMEQIVTTLNQNTARINSIEIRSNRSSVKGSK